MVIYIKIYKIRKTKFFWSILYVHTFKSILSISYCSNLIYILLTFFKLIFLKTLVIESIKISLELIIYFSIKIYSHYTSKNWIYIYIYIKNINLCKTIKNNLLKLNVSGEILPLSIVNFFFMNLKKRKMKKKKLFSLMFRKQP